jgi:hypothetical protein
VRQIAKAGQDMYMCVPYAWAANRIVTGAMLSFQDGGATMSTVSADYSRECSVPFSGVRGKVQQSLGVGGRDNEHVAKDEWTECRHDEEAITACEYLVDIHSVLEQRCTTSGGAQRTVWLFGL